MRKAILIDGNSLAYRAFYALPDTMKNSEGIATNAIYGFASMLLKLVDENPGFMAVAFDHKAPTFRHKEYKEYKATREKAPPTLYEQMPYIKELVSALNIPVFEIAGFEADDIIGTLAKKAERESFSVEIVSGDLDPLQLVNDRIKVLTTRKGISDTILYDEKAVIERYGLKPEQLIDFKALKGDTSDNVPGMPGIGEKTAAELMKKYGTLDNLLKHVKEITKPKLRATLETEQEKAHLSRRLVTIITDVPLEAEFNAPLKINWEKAVEILRRFEFDSLVKKLQKEQGIDAQVSVKEKRELIAKYDFKLINNSDELEALIEYIVKHKTFAFDTETDSLDTFSANLIGISFSCKDGEAYYLPFGHKAAENLAIKEAMSKLRPLFANENILKIGHNLKYDIEVLKKYNIEVAPPHFDTMVAAYLLDPVSGGLGLKKVGAHYLKRHEMIKLDELIGKDAEAENFAQVPLDTAKDYACSDANVTFELCETLHNLLKQEKMDKLFSEIEMPLLPVLISMEEAGVFVDSGKLKKLSLELEGQMKELERHIFAIAGETFNLNSPKQLAVILFEKLQLPVIKKTKTGASTDAFVLDELSGKFEIAGKLLEYRSITKLKSTYIDALPELVDQKTGRIHTSFNQTITSTGRLSSSAPNLQNIPIKTELGKKIRAAFVPQKKGWKILAADYSQIELRILAHLSKDERLLEAFEKDEDVHAATAADIFNVPLDKVTKEMRSAAKTVNFGIIYGISDFGLAKSLKIKRAEAAEYIKKYFERYTGVQAFIKETIEQAKKDGFVCTMLGRKRPLPDINSPNFSLKAFAERAAINTPVQGTAADMIKLAMINIFRKCQMTNVKCQMILQVHDELVFELPEDEVESVSKIVEHEMRNALKLDVPVKVDIFVGNSWAET